MCGPSSAIGLDVAERELWPLVRDRLRPPGRLMAVMRGVLGGDAEVAVVTAVSPAGMVEPLALLVTPVIAAELELLGPSGPDRRSARVGADEVEVLTDPRSPGPVPVAILMTPWIRQHLTLFARKLWR